ncbi:ABC transporter substrate-binding protein [Paenibacillus sanguinis]|uniref:ABC transporter substrate-binding protein n=1 Tax=Paenibacillus sanguinis TaxID=225906 RepID=UPI0003654FD9|nr:MqnA/MqnD/SBP family protein [Paenibacillus sanguinis]
MKLNFKPYNFILACFVLGLALLLGACSTRNNAAPDNAQQPATTESAEGAATTEPAEPVTLTIGGPPSPPSLPILRMIDSKAMGESVQMDFKVWESMDTLGALAKDENVSFLALPLNNAVIMYNKGMDLALMNINTWSVMGMVTTDANVKEWEDLRGTTLYLPMKSSPVDYITQTFLKQHGLVPGEDVTLQYTQLAEGPQLLLSGKASTIVSIQPQITAIQMKNDQVRSIADYKLEWQQVTGLETDLPNAGLATKQSVIAKAPELVARFQEEYAKALKWTLDHPKEAAQLANQYLKLDAKVVEQAIPHMALDFAPAWESREVLTKYYETLLHYSEDSIGGKLPDEPFYYQP